MQRRKVTNAETAKILFTLYREYGIGQFANWLTKKQDRIERKDVVDALCFPETRKSAEKLVEYWKFKIDELESMLRESKVNS